MLSPSFSPEGWIQNPARHPSTAFSKSPTASPPRGEDDESLDCFKAIKPPWILIIGLLFTVCPNTEDIKMSACRAHPMQCTFLMGISGFFYKQLYVTHLVSVAVHSSAARLSISTRHSSGESKRQQKRSIMEMWKWWLSFRTLSFSCPSSYCSTRELSYKNTIANVKANNASHKTQQKSETKSLQCEHLGEILPAPDSHRQLQAELRRWRLQLTTTHPC